MFESKDSNFKALSAIKCNASGLGNSNLRFNFRADSGPTCHLNIITAKLDRKRTNKYEHVKAYFLALRGHFHKNILLFD